MLFYKKFIKPAICPHCQSNMGAKKLLGQINDYVAYTENKRICPHCQTELERLTPVKPLCCAIVVLFIVKVFSFYAQKYQWLNLFGIALLILIGSLFIALPILLIGILNSPYVVKKQNSID